MNDSLYQYLDKKSLSMNLIRQLELLVNKSGLYLRLI